MIQKIAWLAQTPMWLLVHWLVIYFNGSRMNIFFFFYNMMVSMRILVDWWRYNIKAILISWVCYEFQWQPEKEKTSLGLLFPTFIYSEKWVKWDPEMHGKRIWICSSVLLNKKYHNGNSELRCRLSTIVKGNFQEF